MPFPFLVMHLWFCTLLLQVHVDFKNPACLRALTCALLQDDFQLNIKMPLDRLIPTVPLRLNYILWLEDIFGSSSGMPVKGIDIGMLIALSRTRLSSCLDRHTDVVTGCSTQKWPYNFNLLFYSNLSSKIHFKENLWFKKIFFDHIQRYWFWTLHQNHDVYPVASGTCYKIKVWFLVLLS